MQPQHNARTATGPPSGAGRPSAPGTAPGSGPVPADRTGGEPAVRLRAVRKEYGHVVAVAGVDLDIEEGEFLTLLGPSGSGKTTTLRMIAGFDTPTAGAIYLGGTDVTALPPFDRDVHTVFQDYALFPHMSVLDNVAYALMVRGVRKRERYERAREVLRSVRLAGYDERKPSQLSGGQRQRVALARALVNRPRVLLLDEPLGALDLKLRQQMQIELKSLQAQVAVTFVFVTHDQEEALTMSDRIAVFNDGRIEQVGPPAQVYERPATEFVAGFVGTSNLLSGEVARTVIGEPGTFTVRPEKIAVAEPGTPVPPGRCALLGTVRDIAYVGSVTRLTVSLEHGQELVVLQQNATTGAADVADLAGRPVQLNWDRTHNFRLPESPEPSRQPLEET